MHRDDGRKPGGKANRSLQLAIVAHLLATEQDGHDPVAPDRIAAELCEDVDGKSFRVAVGELMEYGIVACTGEELALTEAARHLARVMDLGG